VLPRFPTPAPSPTAGLHSTHTPTCQRADVPVKAKQPGGSQLDYRCSPHSVFKSACSSCRTLPDGLLRRIGTRRRRKHCHTFGSFPRMMPTYWSNTSRSKPRFLLYERSKLPEATKRPPSSASSSVLIETLFPRSRTPNVFSLDPSSCSTSNSLVATLSFTMLLPVS
jgi:hypothetical protein